MSKQGEISDGQAASDAIRKHTVQLLEPITFGTTIDELFSNELIDEQVYEAATSHNLTTQDKGRKIIREVQKKVKANPKLFVAFCDILACNDTTSDISKTLRDYIKSDKLAKDTTSQMMSLAIKSELKSEERTEFVDLKTSLTIFVKELPKMKGQSKDNMLGCIRSVISNYIDNAFHSGVPEAIINQHIYSLCHQEMLVPIDLTSWAVQQVDSVYKMPTAPQVVGLCPDIPSPPKKCPSLFSDEILYHAIICCNAITTCERTTCRQYFESLKIGHLLTEASMTVTANAHQYLIARQRDRKLIYVAFNSEPKISKWSQKCTFEEGIHKQMNQIPVRFFVEKLKDQWEIVLTGFSFGGMLACFVAASIWNSSVISPEEFKHRVICITFGQPLIGIPLVEDIINTSHEFRESIHLIFDQTDVIPRLLRFASSTKAQLGSCNEKTETSPSPTTAVQAFQQTTASVFLRTLGILQEQEGVSSESVVIDSKTLALKDLQNALRVAVPVAARQDGGSPLLKASCYVVSPDRQLVMVEKDKTFDDLSYFSPSSVDDLNDTLFKQHNMESFCIRTSMVLANILQQVPEVGILKPRIEGVAFHCYGTSEVAVVVLGDQLWFCYEIHLGEGKECQKISTPAEHITRKSIQFNYTPSEKGDISTTCDKITIVLHSHFCEPIEAVVEVKKKIYPCTLRQAQLAKHTPTEVIQLAYLCAMLEQPSGRNSKRNHSERLKTTIKFLEEAVNVVPVESIFYAIAYGDKDVALQCSSALEQRKPSIPPSEMVITASQYAATRVITGCHKEFIDEVDMQIRRMTICFHNSLCFPMKVSIMPYPNYCLNINFQYDIPFIPMPVSMPPSRQQSRKAPKPHGCLYSDVARPNSHQSNKIITPQPQMLPVCTATVQNNLTIPIPPRDEDSLSACPNVVEYLRKFADDIYAHGCSKIAQKKKLAYMCGLNINEVYQTSSTSDHESVLSSPTRVLSDARKKLSQLVKLACEESKGFPLKQSSEQSSPSPSAFHNLEMLQTINKVRGQDLNLCTTLLSAFMEQQIRIPLINSSALETASALSTSAAPIALGVWALFSLNYGDIKEMLGSLRGKPLMVDITNYIMGVFNTPLKMEDARYAGKLQFLLQGMGETISCNSQYVSYSLEQQLVQLYEKRLKTSISLSTDLDNIIAKWDTIFQGDALSLVAKPHRPLIARWLKWAFMIHQLREKLAEYIAVGVIGVTNSGKSHLVNKLFGVETLVGTTQMKRTTIPLMYSINGAVKKLDVIDFPGVDDQDETIPQLAKLLLGLAQIVVFVVDYRKIHTQSARSWLTELESEKEAVPILVCLTHADRLYAEIMAQDNKSQDKLELRKRYIRSELTFIKERLGHSPSRDVDFYSFSQEPDSTLNNEQGRKVLEDVGIHGVNDVGVWIVEKLKTQLDQPNLAIKLQEHFQKTSQ